MLLVLTLAYHPFVLPEQSPELLPPLTPPSTPTVEIQLRPRQTDETPPPQVSPPPVARPAPPKPPPTPPELVQRPPAPPPTPPELIQRQPVPAPQPAAPPSPPVEVRPSQPTLQAPVEIRRGAAAPPRLQTQQAAPRVPETPPEPVQVTRQAPTLQPQVEVSRTQAPGQPRALDTSPAAPQLPQAAAPEAQPAAPSQVQVLTNQTTIQSPVEIRPRERAPPSPPATTQPGVTQIPAPSGAPPPAGGAPGAPTGGQGAAGRVTAQDLAGVKPLNGGQGATGLRQALGCEDPDAYKLTALERAACAQKYGQARSGPGLGLPIAASKQAEYDRYEDCQNAYKRSGGPIPGAGETFEGSSVSGVRPMPKVCHPVPLGDR